MKGIALICLLAIAVTALSPFYVLTVPAAPEGQSVLGNLDVCHSSSPAVAPNGTMPCISAVPATLAPVIEISVMQPLPALFTELIIATGNHRPPRFC